MTEKKAIGSKLALYPCPVAVIGAMTTDGHPTWTLVAHMGIMGHDHVMVSLAQAHYINDFIKESKVCSVNIVDEGFLTQADWCGIASGNKEDKSGGLRMERKRGRRAHHRRREARHGMPRRGRIWHQGL